MHERIRYLQKVKWKSAKPAILTAADAWACRFTPARFYTIHWLGEQPLWFTRIEFHVQIGDLFKVMVKDGSPYGVYYLKTIDLVLMFQDINSEVIARF